ncbi:MAG: hypothetical protein KAJ51_05860 [Thermoplasmata archaeon]|nr:hypothetical protein [Thermoplasmata archaeon]
MDDLAGPGRVVVTACSETQYSWDGPNWMENGVFTYYYMDSLNTINTIEGAYYDSFQDAHDFVLTTYDYEMDPLIFDQYDGDWAFEE